MGQRLREASMEVVPGRSVVVPLIIEGLPEEVEALGRRWRRKREFHMTAAAARVLERAEVPDLWDRVVRVLSGRSVGPIISRPEVRHVRGDADKPGLETLIVMVDAPGLAALYDDLSAALGTPLEPPPAHVTLYSTDPADGIGLTDRYELERLASPLSDEQQQRVKTAIRFDEVFGEDEAVQTHSSRG